jgi:uncharacterized protein (TIGR03437 family)
MVRSFSDQSTPECNSIVKFLRFCAFALSAAPAFAQSAAFTGFTPNNLVLSRSVYTGTASTVTVGQTLPPNCPSTAVCGTAKATDNGTFPAVGSTNNVWNNDKVDSNFGITSPVFLDQITPSGMLINSLAIPTSVVSTSFSSKSELAVNLSTDGTALTFMAYAAPPNTIDVSNSNTPGVYDPTNPVGDSYYRDVVQVSRSGAIAATPTNAYSGNNGRAAFLANGLYYMVGNDNNGSGTPTNIVTSTGVEIATPGQPNSTVPQQVGTFSISQYNDPVTGKPYTADKLGKDNNFRGLTIFNNTLYVTKGSGSNGFNTVYQVGAAGTLPTLATAAASPITVLPGFPIVSEKQATGPTQYPFGIWFANATTLYVADEGDGTAANAATLPGSGLQKWILSNGVWKRVYVLQNGLQLGVPYSIANYPASLNPVTDGLRNITGRVNPDGTVTVWGVTSTVSSNGDPGADPNRLVAINDVLANTDPNLAAIEQFQILRTAVAGEVLRGVSLTPGSTAVAAPALAVTSSANPSAGAVTPNSIAVAYGADLATGNITRLPLPFLSTTLGGTSVSIIDSAGGTYSAAMLTASPSQATFVVPGSVANGAAQVTVQSGDGTKTSASVQVNTNAPGLYTLNNAGLAAGYVVPTGTSNAGGPAPSVYGMNSDGTIVPTPINVSAGPVALALFGTGFRAAGMAGVTATVNGTTVTVTYAGPQLNYPGLDQVNIQLPASLAGSGNSAIQIVAGGVPSNTVHVLIQ